MKGLINGKIITQDRILTDKVVVFDQQITEIIEKEELEVKYDDLTLIDAQGNYIAPGLIDLHIHGAQGYDTMDGTREAITNISNGIVEKGVTGFLATTMTMNQSAIYQALDMIKQAKREGETGAKVLGAHLEGPFINQKYKGAQNAKHICEADYELIEDYLDVIKMITLAPEIDQGAEFIDKINQKAENIVLSMGHSDADYDQALAAIDRGINHATHIFNAMSSFHHRNPGVVGAVFNSQITCDIIADKIHVHPDNFQLLLDIKGQDKVNLITDSMRAGCMKNGSYELGGQQVTVKNGSARLEDGTLAGSILNLNQALKNFKDYTNLNLIEVVKLASLNPAQVLGIADDKGSITVGKDADIIIFDDQFDIQLTVVEGEVVYSKLSL